MSPKPTPADFVFADLGPVTTPWTTAYRLKSRIIDQTFLIQVSWPPVALADGQRLPVVYVLDGNHTFGMAAHTARALQAGPFPMPPTLVVGVGYHFENPRDHAQWGTLRVRDFSPCGDALFDEQYPAGAEVGGADAFLRFFEEELKPFVELMSADVSDQTLVGASLGGLFTLYAMLTKPEAFQRYIAISPAIFWGDGRLFELEAELAARVRDLPAKLYLASGGLEEAHDARQAFVSNLYRFEAALRSRAYPGLDMALKVFDGENHMSVYPGAVTRGLGHVFGGYPNMDDWSRALRR